MRIVAIILLYSLVLLLTGCNKPSDYQDLQHFIEETQKMPAQPIEGLPKFTTPAKLDFKLDHLTNPFEQNSAQIQTGLTLEHNHITEPLEAYSLATLKMAGTITANDKNWGIIITPDNTIHNVKVGSYIGQNFGKITAINPKEIKVLELIPKGSGWLQREISLTLK